jgi:hypothetical protein
MLKIRKQIVLVEDTISEIGQPVNPPLRKVAAIAVIENPYAGRYVADLAPMVDLGEELGEKLAKLAVDVLGFPPDQVKGYGKAAIVGTEGELEHCAAVIHPKFGKPIRAAIDGGKAIIPSTKKKGGPGTAIDVPLLLKDDLWSMPYLDAMEVRVGDAPAADEMVVALVMTNGGRPLSRVGGQEDEAKRKVRTGD